MARARVSHRMTYESHARMPMNNGEELRLRAQKNIAACDKKIAMAIRREDLDSVMRWSEIRMKWAAML